MKIRLNDEDGLVKAQLEWQEDQPTDLPDASSLDVISSFKKDHSPELGLLPPAVRYLTGDKRLVVFERPPCHQYLEYIPRPKDAIVPGHRYAAHGFSIPLPWQVYVVLFDTEFNPLEVRIFARNEPLFDMSNVVGLLPLLNLYGNGAVCNPSFGVYEERKATLAQGIQDAYNIVWNSGFNFDLRDAVSRGMSSHSPCGGKFGIGGEPTYNFFVNWSKMRLSDVLSCHWIEPWLWDTNENEPHNEEGEAEEYPKRLIDVIEHMIYESGKAPKPTPEFLMARIANVLMASSA